MIEDEPLLCELFTEYAEEIEEIEYLGYSSDGSSALERCLNEKPDLIILDIRIPEINGLEILTILSKRLPDTRAIIFTGSLSEETLRISTGHNAIAYVEKSYGLEMLHKAIKAAIKNEKFYSPGVQKLLQHFRFDKK